MLDGYHLGFSRALRKLIFAQNLSVPKANLAINASEVLYPIPIAYRVTNLNAVPSVPYTERLATLDDIQYDGSGQAVNEDNFVKTGYEGEAVVYE